jgi:hypothetical protein
MPEINSTIDCPECPEPKRGRKPQLKLTERNYSGCNVDYVACEECGKAWCVSYAVDKIERAEDWDGPSRDQREAEGMARLKAIEAEEFEEMVLLP